ncbi:MAG: transcription-repair coupling factor [Clostridia bacterium]|nr:transcription-repair coupling factor [Clostridia bacterium]
MYALLEAVAKTKEVGAVIKCLEKASAPTMICGLSPVHRAVVAAAVQAETLRPVAVITADDVSASAFAADAGCARGIEYGVLSSREMVFHNVEGLSREWEYRRTDIFNRLLTGSLSAVVGSVEAFLLRTMPPERFSENVFTLRLGDVAEISDVAHALSRLGYARAELVEGMGQFAVRGGILDVYPAGSAKPVRVEFFGDEPDSMGFFDPVTQRRTENIDRLSVPPACELPPDLADGGREGLAAKIRGLLRGQNRSKLPDEFLNTVASDSELVESGLRVPAADRYLPVAFGEFACGLDYLPGNAVIFIDDMPRVREAVRRLARRQSEELAHYMESGLICGRQTEYYASEQVFWAFSEKKSAVMLDAFAHQSDELRPKELLSFPAKQLTSYGGSFDAMLEDVNHYRSAGFSTVVLAGTMARLRHLQMLFEEKGIFPTLDYSCTALPSEGGVCLSVGSFSSGLELTSSRIAVLDDGVGRGSLSRERKKRDKTPDGRKKKIRFHTDLKPGDVVVHDTHGIGRFCGIVPIETDGIKNDFIKLEYAGTDVLYIPVGQLESISKYLGAGEDENVRLSKLGGTEWTKTKSRARSAAKDLAKELIALYAKRMHRPGYAFGADTSWQKEFEDSFEYEETDDQLISTREIKRDMEAPVPMDRLLCGDVGFGKTEVAFRAAMKCMMDGKQVAVLVPTTVLARQHYVTAIHRFRGYPVRIATLSRFSSANQAAEVIRKLGSGQIDMVIGTHKLLGKNVRFADLGLLIVDEEQRFGVAHKEKLKQLSDNADVLTLSATPIPRTLNMALTGIRDMSVLEESPQDRYPVETYVCEYDDGIVRDAIARELARGGQVYVLHNRVSSIDRRAAELRKLLPEARIVVGHGKMDENTLGEVMQAVTDREADVLVCTTIIETGIDIPNVNTLIIEEADRLGLAQLHQIRGRVGRSSRHAYAYLTYRKNSVLSEVSQKRLAAMKDFAEFGAGFKIAMRDLEIRGAGSLLGAEQSGHIMSVGYDMYMRLLEEAVLEEKGEKPRPKKECRLELKMQASIPESYISSAFERMDLYRRIARFRNEEDLNDMADELIDRFGDYPAETELLMRLSLLRRRAEELDFSEIAEKTGELQLFFGEAAVPLLPLLLAAPELKGRMTVRPGERPCMILRLRPKDDRREILEKLFTLMEENSPKVGEEK